MSFKKTKRKVHPIQDRHPLTVTEEVDGQQDVLIVPVNGAAANLAVTQSEQPAAATNDYPVPAAVTDQRPFIWNADLPAAALYPKFARRLAEAGDIYRLPGYGQGLLLASPCPSVPPAEITTGGALAPLITDHVPVIVVKDGKPRGSRIPAADLNCMVNSELFLGQLRPVDQVVYRPMYLGDQFVLTRPGYNDHGRGQRAYYVGEEPLILLCPDMINRFLDALAFADTADRTNAVAAALTVLLRNYWPGAKPIVALTSTKSHGGKDTIVAFMSGGTPRVSISYEKTDWALQKAFVAAVKHNPRLGVVNIENVRASGKEIASAFLERFVTDGEPLLYSPGTGEPVKRPNHIVPAMTTNVGTVSEDLMNRALPIHLNPVGNVADRQSSIGNPKLEFLPVHRDRIEAELRGMVEKWKEAGMPLDKTAKHSFTCWAQTVGGILKANGFADFLGNYARRRTADDPLRKALGLLGAYRPDEWLQASDWTPLVVHLGITDALIPKADRESPESRQRGLGVVLSAHREETFVVETDDEAMTLRLEKARRRFEDGKPETRYRFVVIDRTALAVDSPSTS